jgi:hypothetical protein
LLLLLLPLLIPLRLLPLELAFPLPPPLRLLATSRCRSTIPSGRDSSTS